MSIGFDNEAFELTFFAEKADEAQTIKERMENFFEIESMRVMPPKKSHFPFLNERKLWFDYWEDTDFVEYCLGVDGVWITHSNFDEMLQNILMVVHECFQEFPSIRFATGIYELTIDYFTGGIVSYATLTREVLGQIPFIFLREKGQFGLSKTVQYRDIWYKVNQGDKVQDIFIPECDIGKYKE